MSCKKDFSKSLNNNCQIANNYLNNKILLIRVIKVIKVTPKKRKFLLLLKNILLMK